MLARGAAASTGFAVCPRQRLGSGAATFPACQPSDTLMRSEGSARRRELELDDERAPRAPDRHRPRARELDRAAGGRERPRATTPVGATRRLGGQIAATHAELFVSAHPQQRARRDARRKAALDYQTLANLKWVSASIEVSRRREKLSWTHHSEVAALPSGEQDEWLDLAEQNTWTVRELRQRIRGRHETQLGRAHPRGGLLVVEPHSDNLD
jgi:hypothetical protein